MRDSDFYNWVPSIVFFTVTLSSFDVDSVITRDVRIRQTMWIMADMETFRIEHLKISRTNITAMDRRIKKKYHRELKTVFTLNFLPYKPTGPVSSNIYRPTINSTGPNLKTTLMTINSNHQNSKHDDVPNIMWTCQLCIGKTRMQVKKQRHFILDPCLY